MSGVRQRAKLPLRQGVLHLRHPTAASRCSRQRVRHATHRFAFASTASWATFATVITLASAAFRGCGLQAVSSTFPGAAALIGALNSTAGVITISNNGFTGIGAVSYAATWQLAGCPVSRGGCRGLRVAAQRSHAWCLTPPPRDARCCCGLLRRHHPRRRHHRRRHRHPALHHRRQRGRAPASPTAPPAPGEG
jgi:hypothetical protein